MEKAAEFVEAFGFPIVACGALFWLIHKIIILHREERDMWSAKNSEDRAAMTAAIKALEQSIRDRF